MSKVIAACAAAIAMSWAGSASALAYIQQGVVGEVYYGPDRFGLVEVPVGFVGGGRWRVEMTSEAYITDAAFLEYYSYHFHQHAPDGTEIGGNNGDGTYYVSINAPSVHRKPNGLVFDLVVPMDYVTGGPGEYYEEWWFAGGAGGMFSFDEADIGQAYDFRITAVPEPATWAMMIIGFGLVGTSLRQRRRYVAIS